MIRSTLSLRSAILSLCTLISVYYTEAKQQHECGGSFRGLTVKARPMSMMSRPAMSLADTVQPSSGEIQQDRALAAKSAKALSILSDWSADFKEGSSIDGAHVFAVAAFGSDVFVGGNFRNIVQDGQTIVVNHLARFNTKTRKWYAVGQGVAGADEYNPYTPAITALYVDTVLKRLYIGGSFTKAGNISPVSNLAVWDLDKQEFADVAGGVAQNSSGFVNFYNAPVFAIQCKGDSLIVGGYFDKVGGNKPISNIAVLKRSTGVWYSLGRGLNNGVWCLDLHGNSLYAGGEFSADTSKNPLKLLAEFSFTTRNWSELGGSMLLRADVLNLNFENVGFHVNDIEFDGDTLYAGGFFLAAGTLDSIVANGVITPGLAKWSLSAHRWLPVRWKQQTLSSLFILNISDASFVTAMHRQGKFLHFTAGCANDVVSQQRFDSYRYRILDLVADSLVRDDRIYGIPSISMVSTNGSLFFGGRYVHIGEFAQHCITEIRGTSIAESFGEGLSGGFAVVNALAMRGDKLFVGGSFTKSGNELTNNFAIYDRASKQWNAVDKGVTGVGILTTQVSTLATVGDSVLIGGYFSTAGDVQAFSTAIYDTRLARYYPLVNCYNHSQSGAIFEPNVNVIVATGRIAHIAGAFATKDDASSNPNNSIGAIRVDLSGLQPQVDEYAKPFDAFGGWVQTLALDGNNVYLGGYFNNIGPDSLAARFSVAKFDILSRKWSNLANGVNLGAEKNRYYLGLVNSIQIRDSIVAVGGEFSHVLNYDLINRYSRSIALWNTKAQQWSALGRGLIDEVDSLKSRVSSLCFFNDSSLAAAGRFTFVGAKGYRIENIGVLNLGTRGWYPVGGGVRGEGAIINSGVSGSGGKGSGSFDVNTIVYDASRRSAFLGGLLTSAGSQKTESFYIAELQDVSTADLHDVEVVAVSELQCYPNPTTGKFSLRISNGEMTNLESSTICVQSLLGEKLLEGNYELQSAVFDVSSFPAGCYVVELRNGSLRASTLLTLSK